MNNIDTIAKEYSRYLYLKRSGMLTGKYGNKESQRRLQKIRGDLKSIDKDFGDLQIICSEDIKKYAGR